jgi:hypothetical protein
MPGGRVARDRGAPGAYGFHVGDSGTTLPVGSWWRQAALAAAVAMWSGAARGQAAVVWKAPEGCPTEAELIEKATRLLGYSLVQHPTPIRFEAEVTQRADQRWTLTLDMTHEGGATRRSLNGESCQAVAEAAAAAIALALKPPDAEPEPRPAEPAEQPAAPAPEPPLKAPVRRAPKPSKHEAPRLRFAARLVGGADFFVFPSPAFDVTASAGLLVGQRWQIEAFGLWLPSQRSTVAGAEADFQLLGGGARGCILPTEWLVGCLGLEVGQVRARGQNVTHSRAGNATWVAPEADLVVLRPLAGPLSLALEGAAAVPLARTEFQISGVGVHELPVATGRLGLGVEAAWP